MKVKRFPQFKSFAFTLENSPFEQGGGAKKGRYALFRPWQSAAKRPISLRNHCWIVRGTQSIITSLPSRGDFCGAVSAARGATAAKK